MPTITKRGARWQARVRMATAPERSRTFRTAEAARRWAREVESSIDAGDTAAPARLKLADALARYVDEVTPRKRGAEQERRRVAYWRAHHLAGRALSAIRPADLAAHRDARIAEGLSASTVRLELAVLSHLFTVARREWGLAVGNPVADVSLPSASAAARDRRLLPGEEAALERAAKRGPAWLAPMITFAVETAMRRGELGALGSARYYRGIVTLGRTKNGAKRDVPLSPRARAALRALRGPDGAIVVPPVHLITRHFAEAARRAGCADLRLHDLRHEGTSRLFERGLSIAEVAAVTGHKTWAMLRRYTHPRAADIARKLGGA